MTLRPPTRSPRSAAQTAFPCAGIRWSGTIRRPTGFFWTRTGSLPAGARCWAASRPHAYGHGPVHKFLYCGTWSTSGVRLLGSKQFAPGSLVRASVDADRGEDYVGAGVPPGRIGQPGAQLFYKIYNEWNPKSGIVSYGLYRLLDKGVRSTAWPGATGASIHTTPARGEGDHRAVCPAGLRLQITELDVSCYRTGTSKPTPRSPRAGRTQADITLRFSPYSASHKDLFDASHILGVSDDVTWLTISLKRAEKLAAPLRGRSPTQEGV
jgi:hypothetical protein